MMGTCDYCEADAIITVNEVRGCGKHIEEAMEDGFGQTMRAIREAFDG